MAVAKRYNRRTMDSVTIERALERIEDYEKRGLTTAEAVKRVAHEALDGRQSKTRRKAG